jgi:hypothetical protein
MFNTVKNKKKESIPNSSIFKLNEKSILSLIPNKRKHNELPENETMPEMPENLKPKMDAFKMISNRSSNMANPLLALKGKQSFIKK